MLPLVRMGRTSPSINSRTTHIVFAGVRHSLVRCLPFAGTATRGLTVTSSSPRWLLAGRCSDLNCGVGTGRLLDSFHQKQKTCVVQHKSISSSINEQGEPAHTEKKEKLDELQRLQNEYDEAKRDLKNKEAKLEDKQAELKTEKAYLKNLREKQLADSNPDKYDGAVEDARAAVKSAEYAVKSAEDAVKSARERRDRLENVATGTSTHSPSHEPETQSTHFLDASDLNECPLKHKVDSKFKFVAKRDTYLQDIIERIRENFQLADSDDGSFRVRPMLFGRCSRGGKTRLLQEIAASFSSQHPNVYVFRISFNDATPLADWEKEKTMAEAIIRRICFAMLTPKEPFADFRHTMTRDQFRNWLRRKPCLLLIDEINQFPGGQQSVPFLKEFLIHKDRYLVMTTHVWTTRADLRYYLDSWKSDREAIVGSLPLLGHLNKDSVKLRLSELTPYRAIFYGLIPALLVSSESVAIEKVYREALPTHDDSLLFDVLIGLITSVFASRYDLLSRKTPLDPQDAQTLSKRYLFLDLLDVDGDKFRWIPLYLVAVLKRFHDGFLKDRYLRSLLMTVITLFENFRDANLDSGKEWEQLCIIAFLLRLLINQTNVEFMRHAELPYTSLQPSQISYNPRWAEVNFATVETIDGLLQMQSPPCYPHVAVCYPSYSKFPLYDFLVVVWNDENHKTVTGYQCKSTKQSISSTRMVPNSVDVSVFVEGKAANKPQNRTDGWTKVSRDNLDEYFGDTGKNWTPQTWDTLMR